MTASRYRLVLAAAIAATVVGAPATALARLSAPRLQSPANGESVQALPAFTWGGVRGAAQYQFELAADRKFTSAVNGLGQGPITVQDTAITDDKSVPDGTYYWRVRGVSAADRLGAWSPIRVLNKRWTVAPQLTSPVDGATVTWPTSPLVLHWNSVPYATQYDVWIATDPGLSNLVQGDVGNPVTTQGTVYSFPTSLAPGVYYWAITPVDAEGDRGPRSRVQSFTWTWPSTTTTAESDISTDATFEEPALSWAPIPGAASYQVEINKSPSFPTGSKLCCNDTVLGTSFEPLQTLPNTSTLYWRVRAVDPIGDGGTWNTGPSFTQTFDTQFPTVTGLTMLDTHGDPLSGPDPSTSAPIVSWDPVSGASSYEIEIIPYNPSSGLHCDQTKAKAENTTNTYWTPAALGGGNLGQNGWPTSENGISISPVNQYGDDEYCVGVAPLRDDGSIASNYTYLNGADNPSFAYTTPTAGTGGYKPTPSSAYQLPGANLQVPTTHETPLFTWTAVSGANGYYVVVAKDPNFTDVIDVGFTDVTAYAPSKPYPDQNSAYWWMIVPSANPDGSGVPPLQTQYSQNPDNPQSFNKLSIPPTPLSPINGAGAPTDPTFQWSSSVGPAAAPNSGARNYTIEIAGDPSFSNPLEQVTTDSTVFTAEQTFPADRTLYWRVRANDAVGNGLNWSATASFTHILPSPSPLSSNPAGGENIPNFAWTPVDGAISYSMHVDQADGTTRDFTVDSPTLAPTLWWGTGIWRFEVRANFPNNVSGSYFQPEERYVRVEKAPTGVTATKVGTRIIISWNPDPNAKQYAVALSNTEGFSSTIATDQTDDTVWVPQVTSATADATLYWRVAAVDQGTNVGAYASGVFNARHRRKPPPCRRSKHHRCAKKRRR